MEAGKLMDYLRIKNFKLIFIAISLLLLMACYATITNNQDVSCHQICEQGNGGLNRFFTGAGKDYVNCYCSNGALFFIKTDGTVAK